MSVLIGFAAILLAAVCYGYLHLRWFDFEDGAGSGWGDWANQQGGPKYDYYQQLFYNSVYVVTGIITGGIAGAGPVERSRRSLRFAIGPGLMWLSWLLFPVDIPSSARHLLIYSGVVTVTFLASAFTYGLIFRPRPASAERNPSPEGVWPPPPQNPGLS